MDLWSALKSIDITLIFLWVIFVSTSNLKDLIVIKGMSFKKSEKVPSFISYLNFKCVILVGSAMKEEGEKSLFVNNHSLLKKFLPCLGPYISDGHFHKVFFKMMKVIEKDGYVSMAL